MNSSSVGVLSLGALARASAARPLTEKRFDLVVEIGVAAVIAMLSVSEGARAESLRQAGRPGYRQRRCCWLP